MPHAHGREFYACWRQHAQTVGKGKVYINEGRRRYCLLHFLVSGFFKHITPVMFQFVLRLVCFNVFREQYFMFPMWLKDPGGSYSLYICLKVCSSHHPDLLQIVCAHMCTCIFVLACVPMLKMKMWCLCWRKWGITCRHSVLYANNWFVLQVRSWHCENVVVCSVRSSVCKACVL